MFEHTVSVSALLDAPGLYGRAECQHMCTLSCSKRQFHDDKFYFLSQMSLQTYSSLGGQDSSG